MRKTTLFAGPALALALGILASSAQAAPAGGLGNLKADGPAGSAVEKANWRRCGWYHGRWSCWHGGYRTHYWRWHRPYWRGRHHHHRYWR